jgi:hypothetical protein
MSAELKLDPRCGQSFEALVIESVYLAGVIARELDDPLAVVSFNSAAMKREFRLTQYHDAEQVIEDAQRAMKPGTASAAPRARNPLAQPKMDNVLGQFGDALECGPTTVVAWFAKYINAADDNPPDGKIPEVLGFLKRAGYSAAKDVTELSPFQVMRRAKDKNVAATYLIGELMREMESGPLNSRTAMQFIRAFSDMYKYSPKSQMAP